MIKFQIVEEYKDKIDESFMPKRSTKGSAGYDILAADDIVIPCIEKLCMQIDSYEEAIDHYYGLPPYTLDQIDKIIKEFGQRLPLIPTGLKAYFPSDVRLSIYSRSSMPYKHYLIIGNSVATIDSKIA